MCGTLTLIVCILSLFSMSVNASDTDREKRLASEIIDGIMDGDAIFLKSGDHEFLGIYTEAEEAKGAVIIMHGRGFHPDWSDVANPLRVGLAERGWNTLSIQMPVLEKEAKYYDYVEIFPEAFPRIDAAIDFLKEKTNKKIVLIAHSCSVHMAMAWVDAGNLRDLDAFIGIGMGAVDYKQPMLKPFPLEQIKLPVLDVFGHDEYPAVKRGAPERLAAIKKAGNKKSTQLTVPNANHYFTDQGEALLEVVTPWLNDL